MNKIGRGVLGDVAFQLLRYLSLSFQTRRFVLCFSNIKVKQGANPRNRYNQVLQLTQDTMWESDKTKKTHHTQESQEISPFPAGDHMPM